MAAPDPTEVYSRTEWEAIQSAAIAGDRARLEAALDERQAADRLRAVLAASLGVLVTDLYRVEVSGESFGMTTYSRANRSARILVRGVLDHADQIKRDRKRVLGGSRSDFQIDGVPSSEEFRKRHRALKERGAEKEARKLLEKEVDAVTRRAVKDKVLKGAAYKAWRFLDTEYRRIQQERALKRLEKRGVPWVIVVPVPGYCKICAGFVMKPTPIAQAVLPPYHPNCRCKVRAWTPTQD